ncbi:MAG: hypothetical protein JWP04_1146 [Belnapia sp.]|nr:hypothetical protein [Belnapia sp.]
MPILDAHEIAAWALIVGGCAYWLAASRGPATAAMAAALAAIAIKSALIGFA